jgi:iron(III) transport system substrate-binding protein
MKTQEWLYGFSMIVTVVVGLLGSCGDAISQPARVGKSLEEISKLAAKEGRVRMASSIDPEQEQLVFGAFNQKYPMIKVEHTRMSSPQNLERILSEALAGLVENDLVDVTSDFRNHYVKAGVLAGPFEWRKLFSNVPQLHISPDGYYAGVGFSTSIISYNPSLVPPNQVPKKWEDCLNPYWKGKFIVDARPKPFAALLLAWGEEKLLKYARDLKGNQPVFNRSQSEGINQVVSGESLMHCGTYYPTTKSVLLRDAKANVAITMPSEVPVGIGTSLAVMKGAANPNAALLLAGWLASPEGQKGYDRIGRGSPFVEGSEKWKLIREVGAKTIFGGWQASDYEPAILKKIVAAWGFPTGKNQ